MSTFFSREVQAGLDAARLAALKKSSRLRVLADDEIHPVLRLWRDGFAVEAETTPPLRGLVDLYDGTRHLYQCLIITSEVSNGELICTMKRSTMALDKAPLDYVRDEDAPVGYLPGN